MPTIHPSSVIESGAQLADDVIVGPFCYVGPKVVLGPRTRLVSHVTILGRTTLGTNNTVWPQAVLGADPQDLKFKGEDSELIIGDGNEIRESATIHKGTTNGGGVTRIGNRNLIMAYVHLGHDCFLGDHCILANAIQCAGHIHIDSHANVGGATAIHHFVTIGEYAYVGGISRIVHDVPPYMVVEGNPQRVRGVNVIGLARHGFSEADRDHLKDAWRRIFRHNTDTNGVGATARAVAEVASSYPNDRHITRLLDAIRNSTAGVHGRYLESLRQDNRYTNPVK